MIAQEFDVFLAHSSKDKTLIRQLYRKLMEMGIKPWLDEEEIPPGTSFQDELQRAIVNVNSAAICIGSADLGRWQALELKTFISQCVKRNIPVIPVLLPGVDKIPENLPFLQEFHAVSFQYGLEDEPVFYRLVWGITGQKPISKTALEESEKFTNELNQSKYVAQRPAQADVSAPSSEPTDQRLNISSKFIMTIDDVFSITGQGTVVTGYIEKGAIHIGDMVRIVRGQGQEISAKVKGIEQFQRTTNYAAAGENVGLLLAKIKKSDVARGMVIYKQ